MSSTIIRPAFSKWPEYNRRMREAVGALTSDQLGIQPSPERWPLWATVGHTACQRVSWLCGFLGEPGAESTPFPDALYRCPGDDYLEPVMGANELVAALDSTFDIVEAVLDSWTLDMLDEEISRDFDGDLWQHTRGSVIQRVFSHDVWHCAELNETLQARGLLQIDLWD